MIDLTATQLLSTPIGFIEGVLEMPLYPWQRKAVTGTLNPLKRTKISVCTPNGAGKSQRIVAGCALRWLAVHPKGKVVITTKDAKQLEGQVLPAIHAHRGRFPGWKWNEREIFNGTGGFIKAFTTDEPGRAEGWHGAFDLDGPLLIIIDEAKSVDAGIFSAIDRCTYQCLMLTSSPGVMQGEFFDSHTKNRAQFITVQAGLADCPHISQAKIDDIVTKYGEHNPFTRSTLYGEFMADDDESKFIVSLATIQSCLANPPALKRQHEAFGFCDFAAGGDENVLAIRRGNMIEPLICWRERNTMSAVGRFIMEFRKAGLRAEDIFGDVSGLGKPMIDALAEAGWAINSVNNGEAAFESHYMNRGAEMWHETAATIRRHEIQLPDDDTLIAQLTARKSTRDSKGRLGVESKADMARRGASSPDRADAVCGVIVAARSMMPSNYNKQVVESWRDRLEEQDEEAMSGFNAGY